QDSEGRVISGAPGIAADGILFDRSAQAAGVTVADCLPVLLVAEDTPLSALLHSGFRGTGIVSVALRAMRELAGVEAERVTAVLGPCIAGECYAVPRERAERFRNTFGVACAWHQGDQSYIDMRAANLSLLEAGGVQRVTVMNVCTHCDPRLGSYRRDGANFFRMLAIAGAFRE
ncbi:MAG: polyphenol oxidase family protein, partial [bacterium]